MSLPTELTGHLVTRLGIEFGDRDTAYQGELNKTLGQFAAKGMLGSGALCVTVFEQGRLEFRARAQLTLGHFLRNAATFDLGYAAEIAAEANRFLQDLLATQRKHLRDTAAAYANRSGVYQPSFSKDFEEATDREARRIESELQLWEVQLKERKENPTSRNVVNVTGNYNLIQAGTVGSTASIVIDADSRGA